MLAFDYSIGRKLSKDQIDYVEKSITSTFEISGFSCDGRQIALEHAHVQDGDRIRTALKRTVFIAKNINKDVVFENTGSGSNVDDPQPHLEAIRDVAKVAPGLFTLQGGFLKVFHAINRTVRGVAERLNAIEQEYPAVWPVRLFRKINYFAEFPHQVILCTPVKNDYASREEFARTYAADQEFTSVKMDRLMADAEFGLEAAVCDCCYYGLEGARDLRNALYTCYNKVFRNELSATGQLDRLTNFSVRDIMFVGTAEFVLESRQRLIEELSDFLVQLSLHAKIETANDPFFTNESAMKSVFQNAHRLKYELLAYIPHLDRPIAVGSVNLHLEFFGNTFDIRTAGGECAHSGCIGIGMERMTYALYCQHGPELQNWPTSVLDFLEIPRHSQRSSNAERT